MVRSSTPSYTGFQVSFASGTIAPPYACAGGGAILVITLTLTAHRSPLTAHHSPFTLTLTLTLTSTLTLTLTYR